ncbi:MAG TPA: HSP90 family protein, partial [Planctomycetaceae bacterium]|nr:HSP90 family protein [Planctomycetaceae bacterium]
LLPDWAFFVRCVVNATGLRPTANREAFYEDETLAAARDALGQCLRRYLVRLAHEDRRRLDAIIELHHLPMKALAAEDDEFYRLFVQWLPFETSLGRMTLAEFWERDSKVRYTRTVDEFRQIASVAAAQSIGVINGGYVYDGELLEKLPQVFPDTQVERVDVSELAESFEDLSLDERDEVFGLVRLAEVVLQPFRCAVDVKKFRPAALPTLYTTNDAALFLRSIEQSKEAAGELWSGVLDSIAQAPAADAFARLCLNYRNPLIRRLARVEDRRLLRRAVEMLYVQALLLGHYPLKAKEMELLTSGLLGLIEHSIESGGGDA